MTFFADLHVHSRYSRATSAACTLEGLHHWAQVKGVSVVGVGDMTHPAWLATLREQLEPSAPGLYALRASFAKQAEQETPASCRAPVHFMLTGEISSIYKRDGRVRKVHSLVLAPDFKAVDKINARLEALGNIRSDGRPILGLDPRDLLEIALEADPACVLIPAHIWTPWFSMLGSKSGFDSLEACFGDLSRHVFAVETGLSSDPPMNWRVSSLDGVALVSNSDLHSPENLGRNANVFFGHPDYFRMMDGLRRKDPSICGGTIDLFPEAGKYHLDGHRTCDVCYTPDESRRHDNRCPVCGKELVLGVLHRVEELADRLIGKPPSGALPCRHIIPLPELIGEMLKVGASSKRVRAACQAWVKACGPELRILLDQPVEEVAPHGPPRSEEALRHLRAEHVFRHGGYDGVYGKVRVFS